jgi:hypothetical protein
MSDAPPRQVFAILRQELTAWLRSDWLELNRLLARYIIDELWHTGGRHAPRLQPPRVR